MAEETEGMGPVDYVVIEWQGDRPKGVAAGILVGLVDAGLIRIIDLAFLTKDEEGNVTPLDISALADESEEVRALLGANSDLLSDEDMAESGSALAPGTAGAVLVYENRWAAPFADAVRHSGGELVANGRIPMEDLVAALDAAESN